MPQDNCNREYTVEGERGDWRYYKTGIVIDFFTGKRKGDEKWRIYWIMNDGRMCHYSFNTAKVGDKSITYMFIDADNCEPNLVVVAEKDCPMIPTLKEMGVELDGTVVENGVPKNVYFMNRSNWFTIEGHRPAPWHKKE